MEFDDASKLTPGAQVGEWVLVRKLGEGAMGVVFEARGRNATSAALKIVRPELLADADHSARFKREGRVLQRIDHRNVVRLLDIGEASGFPYLALSFIEGDSLADYLEQGPLPLDETVRFAGDMLRGLAAIHEAGVLHRDLKPGNVMLAADGDWKITDFGLARREKSESIVVTQPGTLLGTPYYMSPEMCLGESLDARSDLYSAGATIYHAVTGEAPFRPRSTKGTAKGTAVMEVITAHIREKAPDLAEKVPGVSPALSALVARLLAKKPADRPATARAALALLGPEGAEPPLPPPTASAAVVATGRPLPPPARRDAHRFGPIGPGSPVTQESPTFVAASFSGASLSTSAARTPAASLPKPTPPTTTTPGTSLPRPATGAIRAAGTVSTTPGTSLPRPATGALPKPAVSGTIATTPGTSPPRPATPTPSRGIPMPPAPPGTTPAGGLPRPATGAFPTSPVPTAPAPTPARGIPLPPPTAAPARGIPLPPATLTPARGIPMANATGSSPSLAPPRPPTFAPPPEPRTVSFAPPPERPVTFAPPLGAPGAETARRLRLTPSGRVPGIVKPDATPRGSRIPWERATIPLSPAIAGSLVWIVSRIANRPALFDLMLEPRWVLWATVVGGILGAIRVFTGFFEVNAPASAKAKSFRARVAARLRARRLEVERPKAAAQALVDLGEPIQAAELLASAGLLREAAAEYLRLQDLAKAASLFERVGDTDAAIDAYSRLSDPRGPALALEAGRFVEAARLFVDQKAHAQAADAYQRAGMRLEAANMFETAGLFEDAGEEIVRALEDAEGPLAQQSTDDRRAHGGRAADLFARAGVPLRGAQRLEALGELGSALHLYEQGGELAQAAALASKLGHHEQAADLYLRAGMPAEAAKARGEAIVAASKASGRTPGELDLGAAALQNAARSFEAAGETRRAADLFARSGDLAAAARLYEQSGAWREASLCLRELGDLRAAARSLEHVDPVGAAESFAAAGEPEEALRLLGSVADSSPLRTRAVALLGDVHMAAGHETEAAAAFSSALDAATGVDALRLGRCVDGLVALGRLDQAIEKLGRLRTRFGDAPELVRMAEDLGTRKRTATGGEELLGCVVDRYRVEKLLGEGGTAWVYEAEHAFLHHKVALKVLKPHPTGGSDLATRFYGEAQATAGLAHPSVIHVFDVGATPGGLLYMALELVPGDGLRRRMENAGHLSVPQATWIMKHVLDGLAAAHAKGIVHRDLKPENILLTPGDRPKVVDFGIAKVVASKVSTMTGTFLGTPKYASPEQAQGHEATLATDIYACGLILYEMLAGRSPFESETPLGYLTKHATAPAPPLEQFCPGVPAPLAAAIMRSLDKDPAKRWPDAETFGRAIAPYAAAPGAAPAATYVEGSLPVVRVGLDGRPSARGFEDARTETGAASLAIDQGAPTETRIVAVPVEADGIDIGARTEIGISGSVAGSAGSIARSADLGATETGVRRPPRAPIDGARKDDGPSADATHAGRLS